VLYVTDKELQQSHRSDKQNQYIIKLPVWIALTGLQIVEQLQGTENLKEI